MGSNHLDQRLAGIIAKALGLAASDLDLSSSTDTVEKWDSLAHLQVIMEIEQAYGVRFSTEEIPQLTSVQKLQDTLAKLGVL